MTILRFALKRSFRGGFNILLLCMLPVGVVFIPSVEGTTLPLGIHFYGQVVMFAAFLMVRSLVDDRTSGVLTRVMAAPVSYFRYLWETLLAYGILLILQNAVVVGLGVVLYGKSLGSPLLQWVAFSCFSLTSIALCLVVFSLFGRRDTAYGSLWIVILLLSLVGGFYWPVDMMPGFLQRVARVTPPYWLVNALTVLQRGDPPARFALSVVIMLLFTMAFLVVGSRRRME
ncbi:MAG: ABC transporter permease [Spirochaetales bacterium]|nr:ABC transporter permease [Spirochaetales bacterium]